MIRIAIVNDVPMAAEVLRRIVSSLADAQVAWIARDGREAVEKCRSDTPEVVLMDLIMPGMDGVEATRQIMRDCPCAVLVVTATVTGNCNQVYEALGHGALDAVNTPVMGRDGGINGGDELKRKIVNIVRLSGAPTNPAPTATDDPLRQPPAKTPPILAIGSSTGGPQALSTLLAGLSAPIDYSVVVVQHLDKLFVPGLVDWLAYVTKLPVHQIEPGLPPVTGSVGVASTADHLVLTNQGDFQYVRQPADHIHRPSVDVLFHSLAKTSAQPGVATLLTGMGRDGAAGMKALHDRGWKTIVQDQPSSIVWGMPGAAVKLGAVDHVLPLVDIGPQITKLMKQPSTSGRSE